MQGFTGRPFGRPFFLVCNGLRPGIVTWIACSGDVALTRPQGTVSRESTAALRPQAFTLIELLVVIAIISTLAAILFPVFMAARAMARRTVCISNLRQQGLALQMYREDDGDCPPHLSAIESAYVREPRIFLCPSDPQDGHFEGNERVEGDLYL